MSVLKNNFFKIMLLTVITLCLGLFIEQTKALADYCIKNGGTCTNADPHNNNCKIVTSSTANGWEYCPSGTACVQSLYDKGAKGTAGCKYTGPTCASVGGNCQYSAYTCNNPGGHTYSGGNLDCGVGGSTSVCCLAGSTTDKSCTNKQGQCAPNGTICGTSNPTKYTPKTETDAECGSGNYCCYLVLKNTSTGGTGTTGTGTGGTGSSSTCNPSSKNATVQSSSNNSAINSSAYANGATRVDATVTLIDASNVSHKYNINGVKCAGTTCTITNLPLSKIYSGVKNGSSYKISVLYNSWNSCDGATSHPATSPTITIAYNSAGTPLPSQGASNTYATASVGVNFEGIDSLNNTKPKHLQRQLTVYLYKDNSYTSDPTSSHPTFQATDVLTFQSGNSNNTEDPLADTFVNNQFNLRAITTGDYYVLLKSKEGSLRQLLSTQKIHVTAGANTTLVNTNSTTTTVVIPLLVMGDIDNDNLVNINDYADLIDCYGGKMTQSSCTNHNLTDTTKGVFADINDDGVVDGIDYNILIRNLNINSHGN